jgi:ABC-type transport system involved in multi-copper enzyme maturation permease subunit
MRTIRLVAGFDLYESLRSRKAIALLLVYLVIAAGGCALFIWLWNEAMQELAERIGGQQNVETLLKSDEMVDQLAQVMDDNKEMARELLSIPPLALYYLWLATTFMPLVVALTSSDAIASEVSSGSVRYALFRVDRLGWALGKLAGQTLLMVCGILLGAVAAWILGLAMMQGFESGKAVLWLLRMSGRAAFYGFAYLGIAMCASQLVRGPWAARGLGLLFMFLCWLGGSILSIDALKKAAPDATTALSKLFPNGHNQQLFTPDIVDRSVAMLALAIIGSAFFAAGYARFRARDA